MTEPIRPLILVRGFGGPDVTDEQRSPYQGFNDGTAYPGKRGEDYIYEGFLLRALKSERYPYTDATNVIGYYSRAVKAPPDSDGWEDDSVSGSVVIAPSVARRALDRGVAGTIWVYRYYELTPRALHTYGEGLVRLIELINRAAKRRDEEVAGVDIVAHSMGGLVVREALEQLHQTEKHSAGRLIHRIVTLGTPHRGIAFQRVPGWLLNLVHPVRDARDELRAFDPTRTDFREVAAWFPIRRLLTVVGTDYQSYGNGAASLMNRLSSIVDDGSFATNRSDGLVKQASAQLPGAPRTYVHKCHGGPDSLVTSREAYEIAMRFFHASHHVRLWLSQADVRRGGDWLGRSEFFFGVAVKARYVDFDLFHQSRQAENCYGPFARRGLDDPVPELADELAKPLADTGDDTLGWAGPDRLVWEGWIDARAKRDQTLPDLVFRLNIYVGERDSFGVSFSDNVIFEKQYYVQAFPGDDMRLYVHTGDEYLGERNHRTVDELDDLARSESSHGALARVQRMRPATDGGWEFDVGGTNFTATLRVAFDPDSESDIYAEEAAHPASFR
ncbi:esterase/lipase family protein [Symbioplanes lichenis]|uniref:esterase/lipase family protein n=1 Tax=Symbioplanes lichenis TaxID=1629072 RepID=UPI0027398F53|nr:hypothetical protein [Actinoplanes lichenis]